jgi:tetratricopeptide (TPR) repeat protein
MRAGSAIPLAAFLVLTSPLANADADDEATKRAQALFRRAQVHFSLKEFDKAVVLNKEAYRIKQLPELLFNIGQCYRYLGRCKNAVFYFKEYLARKPDTPYRADVEKMIKECDSTSDRGTQEVRSATSQPTVKSTVISPAPTARRPRPSRAWLWAGAGATAALLITGAVTGAVAHDKNKEFKDAATSVDRREELKDSGQPLAITSVVALGAAAATAVGTTLYYLLHYRRASEPALSAGILDGGAKVLLRGSF